MARLQEANAGTSRKRIAAAAGASIFCVFGKLLRDAWFLHQKYSLDFPCFCRKSRFVILITHQFYLLQKSIEKRTLKSEEVSRFHEPTNGEFREKDQEKPIPTILYFALETKRNTHCFPLKGLLGHFRAVYQNYSLSSPPLRDPPPPRKTYFPGRYTSPGKDGKAEKRPGALPGGSGPSG